MSDKHTLTDAGLKEACGNINKFGNSKTILEGLISKKIKRYQDEVRRKIQELFANARLLEPVQEMIETVESGRETAQTCELRDGYFLIVTNWVGFNVFFGRGVKDTEVKVFIVHPGGVTKYPGWCLRREE